MNIMFIVLHQVLWCLFNPAPEVVQTTCIFPFIIEGPMSTGAVGD